MKIKQLFIVAAFIMVLPLSALAHGGTLDGDTATADGDMMGQGVMDQNSPRHQEMETLMKKFMTEGKLTAEDADKMITHVNELLTMGGNGQDMMNGTDNMMGEGHGKDGEWGMMGGGGMMMGGLMHGLMALTGLVWLIAGVMFIVSLSRKNKHKVEDVA